MDKKFLRWREQEESAAFATLHLREISSKFRKLQISEICPSFSFKYESIIFKAEDIWEV